MASEVKAWSVPVEDFPLRLIVTIGSLDPCLGTTPHGFRSRLRRPGCIKHVIKVKVCHAIDVGDCRALRPAPEKFTRPPRRLFKASSSRLVRRARSLLGSTSGRPAGKVPGSDPDCRPAEPCRGPVKPAKVRNRGVRVLTGIESPTQRFSQYPCLRSSQDAFVRQLPGTVGSSLFGHGGLLAGPGRAAPRPRRQLRHPLLDVVEAHRGLLGCVGA
jgi:hypothetical protein